jgi:hypothetical protein
MQISDCRRPRDTAAKRAIGERATSPPRPCSTQRHLVLATSSPSRSIASTDALSFFRHLRFSNHAKRLAPQTYPSYGFTHAARHAGQLLPRPRAAPTTSLLTCAQNVVSAATELWPTMSAVLKSPWQGFGKQTPVGAGQRRYAQTSTTQTAYPLPECLESVPLSALRQSSSPHAIPLTPTAAGTLFAGKVNVVVSRGSVR